MMLKISLDLLLNDLYARHQCRLDKRENLSSIRCRLFEGIRKDVMDIHHRFTLITFIIIVSVR